MNFDLSRGFGPHHYSKIRLSKADKQKMTSLFGQDAKHKRRRSISCGCWGRGAVPPGGDGRRSEANSTRGGLVTVDGDFYYRPSVEAISRRYRDANYSAKSPSDRRRFDVLPDPTNATAMASKTHPVDSRTVVRPPSERKTPINSGERQLPASDGSPVSKPRKSQMEKTPKATWGEAEQRYEAENDETPVSTSSRKENNRFMANEKLDAFAESRKPTFLTDNLKKIGKESTIPHQSAKNSTPERHNCHDAHLSKDNRFAYVGVNFVKYTAWSKGGYDNSSYTSHAFDEFPEDHGQNEALDSVEYDTDDSVFTSNNSEPIYEDMEQMSRGLTSIQLAEFADRFESKGNRFEQLDDYAFVPPPPEFR